MYQFRRVCLNGFCISERLAPGFAALLPSGPNFFSILHQPFSEHGISGDFLENCEAPGQTGIQKQRDGQIYNPEEKHAVWFIRRRTVIFVCKIIYAKNSHKYVTAELTYCIVNRWQVLLAYHNYVILWCFLMELEITFLLSSYHKWPVLQSARNVAYAYLSWQPVL